MINLPIKVLTGLGVAGAVGGGGYGIYSLVSTKKIRQTLLEEGLTLLSVDESSNVDDAEWDKKVTKLGEDTQNSKLKGYKKDTTKSETEQKKVNRDQVKGICKDLLESYSSDLDKLGQARGWCTKDKSPS